MVNFHGKSDIYSDSCTLVDNKNLIRSTSLHFNFIIRLARNTIKQALLLSTVREIQSGDMEERLEIMQLKILWLKNIVVQHN